VKPSIHPGRNIALKVPPHQFDETVTFYRDVLQLPELQGTDSIIGFDFDGKDIWIDSVATLSHAEVWFEIYADNLPEAEAYFEEAGTIRRDEIEKLPNGFQGFWIANPAGLIHLVSSPQDT